MNVLGVWFGGRSRPQVSVRRLNHGPLEDGSTPKSATVTGYFANLPSAQLGTHWFSSSVPCPRAAVAVQSAQVRSSTRTPSSAQASTIDDGLVLSGNGSALAQLATTPTAAAGAGAPAVIAGDPAVAVAVAVAVAAPADAVEFAAVGFGAVGEPVPAAARVGEAVAAAVELAAAVPFAPE